MELSLIEAHLAQAKRHVREAEQRVMDQQHRVPYLIRHGHDPTDAQQLLMTLEQTLTLMRLHWQRMLDDQATMPR